MRNSRVRVTVMEGSSVPVDREYQAVADERDGEDAEGVFLTMAGEGSWLRLIDHAGNVVAVFPRDVVVQAAYVESIAKDG